MDHIREKLASRISNSLPILPPQATGFTVGDILLVNRDQNPAPDRIHGGWFDAVNENISTFLPFTPPQDSLPISAWISLGKTTEGSIDMGIKALLPSLFSVGGRFSRNREEVFKLFINVQTLTNARNPLNDLFFDHGQMSRLFRNPGNRNNWIVRGRGVVAVVQQSWGGDIIFQDAGNRSFGLIASATVPIPTAVPAAAGASLDARGGTAGHLAAGAVGVVGFNGSIFKLALVEGEQYMQGPIAILNRRQESHNNLAEAVSWSKLGNLYIRDGSREARELTAGMKKLAQLVAPLEHDSKTWVEAMTTGVGVLRAALPALPPQLSNSAKQCAFSVTHDTSEISCGQAREAIVKHLGGGSFGDVTMDDAPDKDKDQEEAVKHSGYHGSRNVIFWYSEEILSNVFAKLKKEKGSLELGGGFRLKDMRPALVFDMDKALLLPVYLSPRYVPSAETPFPTKVFRALKNGAFLITPVQGVPTNCEAQGLVLGNGGCEGWEMKI